MLLQLCFAIYSAVVDVKQGLETVVSGSNTTMQVPPPVPWLAVQVRNRYVNKWMRRDVKRRQMVKQHAVERLRITALRRNSILPLEIQVRAALVSLTKLAACWELKKENWL